MNTPSRVIFSAAAAFAGASIVIAAPYVPKDTGRKVHDMDQPQPAFVEVAPQPAIEQPTKAPSDAIVLFDGKDLSKWETKGKSAPTFKVEDGVMVASGGDITTKEKFGDVQVHVDVLIPPNDDGKGQDRGNSGIKLMGQYEIQVLDTYKNQNKTYADGTAGAVYGQYVPEVNVCRKPGEWQSYDIVWRAPKRDASGEVVTPAYVTVLLNGILVQDHVEVLGNTSGPARGYKKHEDQEPLLLQFHNHPVRFRNVWVRRLDS
jgi:hypothetical protein